MSPRHEFEVMCPGCGDKVHHRCHEENRNKLKEAFISLLNYVPGCVDPGVKKAIQKAGEESGWIEKGLKVEETPFFGGEPWTYGMFGKEDGRSVKAYLNGVMRAAGFDPETLRTEAYQQIEAKETEKKRIEKHRTQNRDKRQSAIKLFKSKAPLAEKVVKLDEILEEKSNILDPNTDDDSGSGGWNHLYRWLHDQYEGGINEEVNRQRIENMRTVARARGTFILRLRGSDGGLSAIQIIFEKRFMKRTDAEKALAALVTYNPLSKNPFERAIHAMIRTNADCLQTYVRNGDGTWAKEDMNVRHKDAERLGR